MWRLCKPNEIFWYINRIQFKSTVKTGFHQKQNQKNQKNNPPPQKKNGESKGVGEGEWIGIMRFVNDTVLIAIPTQWQMYIGADRSKYF